jgi:hypothetical protein
VWQRPGLRLLGTLSATAYGVLLMQTESKVSFLVTACLALVLAAWLCWRTPFLEKLLAPRDPWLTGAAGLLSLSAVYTAKSTFFSCFYGWMAKGLGLLHLPEGLVRVIPWGVMLLALPMAFSYFLWFLGTMGDLGKRLWKESDITEWFFLLTAGCIFTIMIVLTYMCTQAFYGAHVNGGWFNFDLVYSADSGYLVHQDVFRNVGAEQNDLRQPLFGVFAMPLAQGAYLLSRVLFFIPNSYVTISQILQMGLYLVALVLLSRMLDLRSIDKALFLGLVCVTYPVLIFALTAEQYLFAVSYLILLLYLREEPVTQATAYIAATGSLLTSGVWFPLVTWDRDLRTFCKKTIKLCLCFFGVMILSGRLTTFLDIPSYIAGYGYYTGADVALGDKLMQFVNFAGSCLVSPPSGEDFTTYQHVSWQMLPVTSWSPVGLLVLAAALGGIGLGWRRRFTKLCAFWLGFGLVLLGLVGWGTIDNGLMLYSLYFGWAFVAMIFQLLHLGFQGRLANLGRGLTLLLVLGIGVYNVYALNGVLVFCTQFFPALGG